ncbi:hypothetical protein ABIA95_003961 [Bradyrhizobium sp. LA8.1]
MPVAIICLKRSTFWMIAQGGNGPNRNSKSSTIWSAEDEEMLLHMQASGASFSDMQQISAVARHQSKLAIPT